MTPPHVRPYEAVLLDIEGTITPISFVYDTLFTYAHDHAMRFLKDHWDEVDVQKDIEDLRRLCEDERERGVDVPAIPAQASRLELQRSVRDFVHHLIHADSKATALKSLQGKMWQEGYEQGHFFGEFYDDAIRAMARWNANDVLIAIYSSGSVAAQQLLFEHSSEGDLRPLVAQWFDTTTGPKRERTSYEKIADELELTPSSILFATDVVAEAAAAHSAGFQVVVLERLGNHKQPAHTFPTEETFEMV